MKKSNLRASAALQALALMGAGVATAFVAASPAAAQDYTSGAIVATVTNGSGARVPGAAVTIRSLSQNQVRNFVTDSAGTFSASGLTPGDYAISVSANGYQAYNDTLTVTAAQESHVSVGLVSTSLGAEVVVTGRRLSQTATGGTTGLNIDVASVNANAPIGHDITSLTLLAPTVQRGVSGFTQANGESVPSVGGSSVAENAYYINGLNITNPDTYIGSARVPFYFYRSVDVQTGGYAAEFGRATGGVINSTTKSGTNNAFIGLHFDWEPRSLQSHSPNRGLTNSPSSVGDVREHDTKQLTLEAGGAVIPDHLFVYGIIQPQRNTYYSATGSAGVGSNQSTYTKLTSNDPFYGAKIDGYITPTQHAEFTIFDTRSTDRLTNYAFTLNPSLNGGTVGNALGTELIKTGGLNWVARYTGDVSSWLTLSGAYGVSKDRGDYIPADTSAYFVSDIRTGATINRSAQTFSQTNIADTKRRFYRGDADIRFTALGQHHIRLGFDNEDLSEHKTTDCVGVLPICYQYNTVGVRLTYEHLGGDVKANDTAYYIEDSWRTPIDGLTLNIGLRDDEFRQSNLAGQQYLNFKKNFGPRLAFSYSPPALNKWKFSGSYGRYFIPPAMNLGFRGRDLYFRETFAYPGGVAPGAFTAFDPITGLPTAPLGAALPGVSGQANCPIPLTGAPGNPVNAPGACAIFGAGIQNPAIAKVVPGTKSTYEDEFILGTRYQVDRHFSIGLNGTYRKLGRVSEDTDFAPQLANYWCDPAHFDQARCDFYSNNSTYMIWNVGPRQSLTVNDWYSALNGQTVPVTLTKGLQFPKVKRSYKAVVLDFNRSDDGRWQAGGSVTWSKSYGNTEGTVKSDAGNGAQADAGSTQDFDYLGLSDYSTGLLPNDHRWQFKAFGAYHFGKIVTLGANIFIQSPNHEGCQGYHPNIQPADGTFDASYLYGPASHYCSTGPLNVGGVNGVRATGGGFQTATAPAPRGKALKTDWMKQIDLSARFNIPYGNSDTRKITLRADVFNVLNSHAITQHYVQHENARGTGTATCGTGIRECWRPDPLYGTALSYQAPRFVRLGLDVMFGGETRRAPEAIIAPPPAPIAPPATQVCANGQQILATDTCPVPAPAPLPAPAPERG